jgi:hypothetical protein
MTYRKLRADEWSQLSFEFERRNVPMPNPQLAAIYGAFDDSYCLVAWLVCQFKLHTEPLVSLNPIAIPGLIAHAEQDLISMGLGGVECFVAASDDKVMQLAVALGFHKGEETFVRRIGDRQEIVQ